MQQALHALLLVGVQRSHGARAVLQQAVWRGGSLTGRSKRLHRCSVWAPPLRLRPALPLAQRSHSAARAHQENTLAQTYSGCAHPRAPHCGAMTTRAAAARELHLERLLRVGTCLAQCGYGAQVAQLAGTARAFRGDAQLWAAHARHRGRRGRTHLMQAACVGNAPRLLFLLEGGADVEAVETEFGSTALHWACGAGRSETARLLVERGGANVNAAQTTEGGTALMYACELGLLGTVRFLVQRGGASVDAARTTNGVTALMCASDFGYLEIVRFLVEQGGANVNSATTTFGDTSLMWACRAGSLEIVRFLVEREDIKVNAARTTDGMTALMLGSEFGFLGIVRLLVERGGASVNAARTNDGMTALMWATQKDHLEVVRYLVDLGGANINAAKLDDGRTALICAVVFNCTAMVHLLVQLGANRALLAANGQSARQFAQQRRNLSLLAVLA